MNAGRPLLLLTCLTLIAPPVHAQEADQEQPAPEAVSYYNDIRPIFQRHCQGCHQPAKRSGGYVMTDHAALLAAGDMGDPGVVPGEPDESTLVLMITGAEGIPAEMPKGKDPLSEDQVELIRTWIAQGAKDDTPPSAGPTYDMEHPPSYRLPPVITSIDYSPDGSLLAVAGYQETLVYQTATWELKHRLVGLAPRIESVAFSPDGKLLAVTGGLPGRFGEVQFWELAGPTLALAVPMTYDTVFGVSWSPDGSKVAFGCADNTVRAIDVGTGEQVLYQGAHEDWVLDTVFSTKGTYVVSVGRDRSAKLTEVSTQRFVDNVTSITPGALKGGLLAVARHPSIDAVLLAGADGVPKIYRIFRVKKRVIGDDFNLVRLFEPMPGRAFAAEFSPDGTRLAVGSSLDGKGEVRVYETGDLSLIKETAWLPADKQPVAPLKPFTDPAVKPLSTFEGQQGAVYAISFHSEGKHVASAGFDGVIRINEAETGKLIKEFVAVPLSPDEPVASTAP